jgi:outer membrane lipoprotein-sorting protein
MTGVSLFRAVRWSAPVLVAGAVAVAATGVLTADADPPLPARTAAQLLVDVQSAYVDSLSGTIVQNAELGLPELPTVGPDRVGTSFVSLLTGSHTLRVWYAGPDKQRLALLGTLGETDVIHNGRDAWLWASETNTATHYRLPASAVFGKDHPTTPAHSGLTPQQAAELALQAIDPTTAVTTDGTASVAGRAAYELVLSPRDTQSLVGQLRLAVDAETHIPLRVQVFGRNSGDGPAFEIGFTRISFTEPGDEHFRFTPPPGTKVEESTVDGPGPALPKAPQVPDGNPGSGSGGGPDSLHVPRLAGSGWTTVAVFSGVAAPTAESGPDSAALAGLFDRLPQVSGSWGSGRLLTGALFSALLTDDGRLLVGAVAPDLLYRAAGQR